MSKNPFTLTKVHTGSSNRWGIIQWVIACVVMLLNFELLDRALTAYDTGHPNIFGSYITLIIIISLVTYYFINTEEAYYKASMFVTFSYRYLLKKDELYKYGGNTSDKKLVDAIKVRSFDETTGRVTHQVCTTYKNKQCNTTCHLVLTPAEKAKAEQDGSLNDLLNSLTPEVVHKVHVIQCKDIVNRSERYAKLLEDKDAPEAVREENYSLMLYFQALNQTVEWVYAITLGVGLYADDKEANNRVKMIRDAYLLHLNIADIKYRVITKKSQYALLYNQIFSMNQRGRMTL